MAFFFAQGNMSPTHLQVTLLSVLIVGCGRPAPVSVLSVDNMKPMPPGLHRLEVDVPEIGRVRCAVKIAASCDSDIPAPLVVMLHFGYSGMQPPPFTGERLILNFESALEDLNGVTIAPDVLSGNWTDARNEEAVLWLVRSTAKAYNIDPRKVIIAGFSMGGEGTWYIGSRHQDLFTAAIPMAGRVAGTTEWQIPVRVIHADTDDVVPYEAARIHAEAIRENGGNIEFTTAPGFAHYDTARYAGLFHDAVASIQAQW